MQASSRVRHIFAWTVLALAILLGLACALSWEREFSYNDGASRSYALRWGHIEFARYHPPAPEELTGVRGAQADVQKYMKMRFAGSGWRAESHGVSGELTLRLRRYWLPPFRDRRYVWQTPAGIGGSAWMSPGAASVDPPDAANSAWCVAVCRTVPLQIPFVVAGALAAITWLPRTYRRVRGYRWRAQGRCAMCGYDLTGNVSGRCPECGTASSRPARSP